MKRVLRILAIIAMTIVVMASCDKLDNPVRYAEELSISGDRNEQGQIEMMVGMEQQLIIIMDHYWTPTKDRFTWTSSDTSVATVSENGLLKAVGNGTALITARWTEDPSRKATVEVVVKEEQPEEDMDAIIVVSDDEVSQDEAEAPEVVFGK